MHAQFQHGLDETLVDQERSYWREKLEDM